MNIFRKLFRSNAKHDVPAVPEIQGKAKSGKVKANPIIAGTDAPSQRVYHGTPRTEEKPISSAYSEIDTDLARDNIEKSMKICKNR